MNLVFMQLQNRTPWASKGQPAWILPSMASVVWLCGVGWCFTMCCWVPDPYGKQPRPAVTDMER